MNCYFNDIIFPTMLDENLNTSNISTNLVNEDLELQFKKVNDVSQKSICVSYKTIKCYDDVLNLNKNDSAENIQPIIIEALFDLLHEIAKQNMGPTKSSRIVYCGLLEL